MRNQSQKLEKNHNHSRKLKSNRIPLIYLVTKRLVTVKDRLVALAEVEVTVTVTAIVAIVAVTVQAIVEVEVQWQVGV